ncbi:MAG: NAD(P)H-binding protein [Paludibacter sp.]|nr:NAD(P)H-binding protein [Paludibacter sp.]
MKILVFGANGKVGTHLVKQALENGHDVIAYVRKACSLKIEHPKLKVYVGNLNETLKLRDAISEADACISALGGGSLTRHATEVVAGIENIVTIMEQENIHRFIYLSSIGAGQSRFLIPQPTRFFITKLMLRVPLADHTANEQGITKSNLLWTIVRPGGLTDGKISDNLKQGVEKIMLKGNPTISRASVAAFMLRQVSDDKYLHKCVWLYE